MKLKKIIVRLLWVMFVTLLMTCCSSDEYDNMTIGREVTYEVPSKGGKYRLNVDGSANHHWCLESIKIQQKDKIVTLYDSSDKIEVCKNQKLENAVGYCCDDYNIYQLQGSKNVVCKLSKNTSGSDRTFIVEFSDGDEFTKVKVHQAK